MVVSVMGCAAPGPPRQDDWSENPDIATARRDLNKLRLKCRVFNFDHGRWPEALAELVTPPPGQVEKYLDSIPSDPWGRPYHYVITGNGISIYTLGADNAEGGEGINADLHAE